MNLGLIPACLYLAMALLLGAGCGRSPAQTGLAPDIVRAATLGYPDGVVGQEVWHLVRTAQGWSGDWMRRRVDAQGRLREEWQTRSGRPWSHTCYTLDADGRVQHIDYRVQGGEVGGYQRYQYGDGCVESQQFNAAGRLTQRVHQAVDAQGRLLRRQTWLHTARSAVKPARTQYLEQMVLYGQDGITLTRHSTDGRVTSRQAQGRGFTVLLHYDDSGALASTLLATAQAEFSQDLVAGTQRYMRQTVDSAGVHVAQRFAQADGSSLYSQEDFDLQGQLLGATTWEKPQGAPGIRHRRRILYKVEGDRQLKVVVEDGRAIACWASRWLRLEDIF
jgi:hypothetical protein